MPELEKLASTEIHAPFEASAAILSEAGVDLGTDYHQPLVAHKRGRERALKAYDKVKNG